MGQNRSNPFRVILDARIPLAGDLRRIYYKLRDNVLSNEQTPIITLRIIHQSSRNELIFLRRGGFEDFLLRRSGTLRRI